MTIVPDATPSDRYGDRNDVLALEDKIQGAEDNATLACEVLS
jgi:hypothetical protein